MSFDAKSFCEEYGIQYWTEGPNVGPGWINIQCPFGCGDKSNHGGFNLESGAYHCWKCGGHSLKQVVKNLLQCTYGKAQYVIDQYTSYTVAKTKTKKRLSQKQYLNWPTGTIKEMYSSGLSGAVRQYLSTQRDFDPDHIKTKYSIQHTERIGSHKYRIIIPIFYDNIMVSYVGRDFTGKQVPKYKACATESEIIHHKHILYNLDNCREEWVVLVEGIFDVWRLGDNSTATFGTSVTKFQIKEIRKRFKRVIIMFDADASKKAWELYYTLQAIGVSGMIVELGKGDPADLKQEEANQMMKQFAQLRF